MKIGVAGASGTIGSELVPFLRRQGYEVVALARDGIDLTGVDVVINLAGAPIFTRFTKKNKEAIYKSRIETTRRLVEAMHTPPKLFISASAVGYYGNQGDQVLDEDHPAGDGFLADVCRDWEEEAKRARCPVVLLRMGVVLTPTGGALKKMITPFRLGLAAILGSGREWMSWISMQDLQAIILFLIKNKTVTGPVNAVSPNPVTNKEFTLLFTKALHRPCLFRMPAWLLRLVLGEFADEVLLTSCRAYPKKLIRAGFVFNSKLSILLAKTVEEK